MRRISLLILLPTALTACAANDVLVQRQSSMEGRLEQVMQAQNTSKSEIAGLALQIKELKAQIARLASAGSEFQERQNTLQDRVKIIGNRLEQLETADKSAETIELVIEEEPAGGREVSVQAEYMRAFGLFSANNYSAAAAAFTTFIADHPESEYAANARFWLGECYFSAGRYREAVDAFGKVLAINPSSSRSATALLKTALAQKKLGETETGTATLRAVIEKYPESEAAVQARQLLDQK